MSKKDHKTSIGGQAVIEGVMMRGVNDIAISVRKPDGQIVTDKKPVSSIIKKYKFLKLPVVRGVVSFIESMIVGTKSLMYSADFVDLDSDVGVKQSKFETWLENRFGDKLKDIVIYFSIFISLILSVGLFILLPTILVGFISGYVENDIVKTIIEGGVRIAIFVAYIWFCSMLKDIQRVFQYHGAEHKTIACYEIGLELTVENAKACKRLHPRCGTSFLLIVMIVSIILFSFLSWNSVLMRMLSRIALLPIVAGISYEIIKFSGRHENLFTKILSAPGMLLQKITTKEPDESQLEVAIASMNAVLTENKDEDKW